MKKSVYFNQGVDAASQFLATGFVGMVSKGGAQREKDFVKGFNSVLKPRVFELVDCYLVEKK